MTTYNTGNPLGSTEVKDLYDNAQNLDDFSNGQEVAYNDRFGASRKSLAGLRKDVADFLIASGYEFIGDYDAVGELTFTRPNQIMSKDGDYWRPSASLVLPYTTVNDWVIDQPKFVSVGDAALRQDLAEPTGAGMIGYDGGETYLAGTVGEKLNELGTLQDHVPAVGPPSTQTDPDDVYALQRRLYELHKASAFALDSNFELRALRGPKRNRSAQLLRSAPFSVINATVTPISWSSASFDTDVFFSASAPTRLTIPSNATVVRVTANVSFDSNATGVRGVYLYKTGVEMPGARVTSPAASGITTSLKVVSDPIRVITGDYFEALAYQSSGGALNADIFSTFSVEVLEWQSRTFEGKRMLISQGLYQQYQDGPGTDDSNLEEMAQRMAAYNIVVLSHVADYNNAAGCMDAKYDYITRLIRTIRAINPTVKIFGYIEGTASAPSGCGYTNGNRYVDNGWTTPTAAKEIERIQMWNHLPGAKPDGIFIDLVSNVYMAASHRDNIYSAIKGLGFTIMSNTTYPSYLNVRFANESVFFGAGDYCLIEGFSTSAGIPVLSDTNLAMAEMALWRPKGIRFAGLCSEAIATARNQETDPGSVTNLNAVSLFNSNYFRGDVYQYDTADLALVTKIVQDPGI